MPTPSQKLAVTVAFVAAGLSLGAAALQFFGDGSIRVTPLIGGLFMLALGFVGYRKLKEVKHK
jgi:hypothetical protein